MQLRNEQFERLYDPSSQPIKHQQALANNMHFKMLASYNNNCVPRILKLGEIIFDSLYEISA